MHRHGAKHRERHAGANLGWLRAAVLGANDGVLSTASLILGVAAASASKEQILLTGLAGLVAGAMSMAAGEYVSVSSQADAEESDLKREAQELADDRGAEIRELTAIYEGRGLDAPLAAQVARRLMEVDALGAHARDELGLTDLTKARPVQAALTSAASFASGAVLPIIAAYCAPRAYEGIGVSATALLMLAILGVVAASVGKAPVVKATARVIFWGALAMAVTAGVGRIVGATL